RVLVDLRARELSRPEHYGKQQAGYTKNRAVRHQATPRRMNPNGGGSVNGPVASSVPANLPSCITLTCTEYWPVALVADAMAACQNSVQPSSALTGPAGFPTSKISGMSSLLT